MKPTDEVLDNLRHNAELVLSMAVQVGADVAIGRSGLEWVDGYIERNRADWGAETRESLTQTIGSFVGESVMAELGGQWMWYPQGLAIQFDPDFALFPMAKTSKHIDGGEGDATISLVDTTRVLLARRG